ncbi:MAG: lipopolysaccharide heptosyltransferase II [Nitrospirae bacterium]|nr:lipopolysaccharide heptosyltransferase II [Nitrospirota bacterium]MBI5694802.1 lipopolysaccharide heptosyltransferase II [Nitrospirota bacterium]
MKPEKILVRATNWVGDVVMSMPAVTAIRKNFPGSHITVLVKPPMHELFVGNPAVNEIIVFDRKGEYRGPAGIARLARELRRRRFDRAILLQNAFEAALITFLANIPVRMGYNTDGRGILLNMGVKVSEETRRKHQVFYYLDMLDALGIKAGYSAPKLYVGKPESEWAAGLLKSHGITSRDLIAGINPGAQYGVAKRWHPERFGQVADSLAKKDGAKVIIFGGHGDIATAGAVQASMKGQALNLAGKTTIRELMALIKNCRLFITNDTGPMHIAAALGVPTLAVFGSTDHIATAPHGNGHKVVREPVNCSPCLKRTCPDKSYICMERVTAASVIRAAREMLGDRVG